MRDEWKTLLATFCQDFVGDQFQYLLEDLFYHNKKTQAFSLKSMLTAFLEHIVNTAKLQRNDNNEQNELSSFIKDVAYKTNSLRSLWARLDGQDDPLELGIVAARHVERRRQRALTQSLAKVNFTLGEANRLMPVVELGTGNPLYHAALYVPDAHLAMKTEVEQLADMRQALRCDFGLELYNRGEFNDLFSAVALVAYQTPTITSRARPNPDANLSANEHLALAAVQLRSVAAADMSHYYRTDERSTKARRLLGKPIEAYIESILKGDYRGDLFSLFWLANHLQRPFRVWLPGFGSVLVPCGEDTRSKMKVAFNLLHLHPEEGKKQWFPVLKQPRPFHGGGSSSSGGGGGGVGGGGGGSGGGGGKKRKRVSFSGQDQIAELPMTDEDVTARLTVGEDGEPLRPRAAGKRPRGSS